MGTEESPAEGAHAALTWVEYRLSSMPEVAFHLAIPQGSKFEIVLLKPVDLDPELLGFSHLSGGMELEVFAARLPGAVDMGDWLRWLCTGLSIHVESTQSLTVDRQDILIGTGALPSGRCAVSVGHNDAVAIAAICCGQNDNNSGQDRLQGEICESLRVVQGTMPSPEVLQTFASANVGLAFRYPETWKTRPLPSPFSDKQGVDICLLSESDTLALIRVERDASAPPTPTGLRAVLQAVLDELRDSGVVSNISLLDAKDKAQTVRLDRSAKCDLPTGEGYINVHVHRGKQGWLIAASLCPSREVNPTVWLRTEYAFKLTVSSLQEV